MATTNKKQDAPETQESQVQEIAATKQDIITTLDELSLSQLHQVQSLINGFTGLRRGVSGADFVAWVSGLRDQIGITDEEFDEFERILRDAHEAEKQRLERPS